MGTFDPSTFLDVSLNEANSTVRNLVKEGEYPAIVDKVDVRPWTSKDQTQNGLAVDMLWSIQDEAMKAEFGQDKILVKQGIMLDLNSAGGIDTGKGKNVPLGKLREALGLNVAGKPFSFRMLEGQMGKVLVKHRVVEGEVFADIKGVAKMA